MDHVWARLYRINKLKKYLGTDVRKNNKVNIKIIIKCKESKAHRRRGVRISNVKKYMGVKNQIFKETKGHRRRG